MKNCGGIEITGGIRRKNSPVSGSIKKYVADDEPLLTMAVLLTMTVLMAVALTI